MQVETLMIIAYCFGVVLNILIAVGMLSKKNVIDLGDLLLFSMMILLSWLGTCIVIAGQIIDSLDHVVYRNHKRRGDE